VAKKIKVIKAGEFLLEWPCPYCNADNKLTLEDWDKDSEWDYQTDKVQCDVLCHGCKSKTRIKK